MDVNVNGVFNGVRTFLPRMLKHGEGGHIVTTSSSGRNSGRHTRRLLHHQVRGSRLDGIAARGRLRGRTLAYRCSVPAWSARKSSMRSATALHRMAR